MTKFPPYQHQLETTQFIANNNNVLVASDPGTGKTRGCIDAIRQLGGKWLVLAPLSILKSSWADDVKKFSPDLTCSIAYAKNRAIAFKADADIYVTNHDAVKWIANELKEDPTFLSDFTGLIIDEFPAFKNRTTKRSKAAYAIAQEFRRRVLMSGTINGNSILDVWHPMYILDDGHRLGKNFFQFRARNTNRIQVGPRAEMCKWEEKPEAISNVASLISDITIRHQFEDCIDIPPHSEHYIYVDLPPKLLKIYSDFQDESILLTTKGVVNAVHAGARVRKLLQLVTGAVYDEFGDVHLVHTERYALVMDLVAARQHSLVAFNWKHERDQLIKLAESQGITYAVIDGQVPIHKREQIVDEFQAGEYQVLFAHPQAAAHGLTLTKAVTTIWSSPSYNAEHFQQFNRRIYRAGQTMKTETIMVAANNTWETDVYEKLGGKLERMEHLLEILQINYKETS